ncbi:MAG: DUF1735 domain-containing protein [Rikenellaceae bacterium]|nr:DUF1735 domain-containing protein [Rikenellaceae bacterium]
MNIRYFKTGLTAAAAAGAMMLASCADDITTGQGIDESQYETIFETNGFVRDANTFSASNIVELYEDTYRTSIVVGLTQASASSVSLSASFDAAYLETYNREHGTDFQLFPESMVGFSDEGRMTIGAGALESSRITMTVAAGSSLDEDKTYVIPVVVSTATEGIFLKEEAGHCIYLVKDRRHLSDCYKGDNLPKGYLFYEVNDTNPLNALSWELEDGRLLWDVVVLFAANINYHQEDQRPYIQCNSNVQYLLDNNEIFLQPLRKRGIKVLLGLLGNGDQAGLAQLSDSGAKDFAREVAQYCYMYNLDGVNYDDEYSKAPDLSNPAFTTASAAAGARLCYETKKVMPDKLVTIFEWGQLYLRSMPTTIEGENIDEWIDIAVANYGSTSSPVGNMTHKKCSGCSTEFALNGGSNLDTSRANTLLNTGYGWFMGFASDPSRYSTEFGRMSGAYTLYGSPLKTPTVFYKKDDPTPYVWPDDMD